MKRFALLSVVAMMVATAVFAPVAMAQELGEVDIQSVVPGPEGSLRVSGTIECAQGAGFDLYIDVRQKQGNKYRYASGYVPGPCQTDGPQPFTVTIFGESPFKKGTVLVSGSRQFCYFNCTYSQFGPETFEVR